MEEAFASDECKQWVVVHEYDSHYAREHVNDAPTSMHCFDVCSVWRVLDHRCAHFLLLPLSGRTIEVLFVVIW